MKKYTYILSVLYLSLLFSSLSAQDNYLLKDSALSICGDSISVINEFLIKLSAGSIKNPLPTKKYSVQLSEGKTYRFVILTPHESEGKAIMQLYYKSSLITSTVNTQNCKFDYLCTQSGIYSIMVSFSEAKQGSAYGLMALISENSDTLKNLEKLFIGVPNPINLTNIPEKGDLVQIKTNKGKIIQIKSGYQIEVFTPDTIKIIAEIRDSNNRLKEIVTSNFIAAPLPLPFITIAGITNGYLSKEEIKQAKKIMLTFTENISSTYFTITGFQISTTNYNPSGLSSYDDFFTLPQLEYIKSLNSPSRLYIYNIGVRDYYGKTFYIKGTEFIIE